MYKNEKKNGKEKKMKNEKIEKELKGKIGQSRERQEEVEQDRNILQKWRKSLERKREKKGEKDEKKDEVLKKEGNN